MTKPTPTHLKLIRGNPGRRPINTREPKPTLGIPKPPAHLNARARAEWDQVTVELHQTGVLAEIDRAVLAAYCVAYARWEQAELTIAHMAELNPMGAGLMLKTTHGNLVQNPMVGTARRAQADMVRYASEFGMSPSARTRIHAEKKNTESEFAEFLR